MSRAQVNRPSGFTAGELLIALAIVSILAAIAVPNLLTTIQRGKQRRTMCDMRTLGAALEAYTVDHHAYPAASCGAGILLPQVTPLKAGSFANLVPTYIIQPPLKDGWGREFGFGRDSSGDFYVIQSRGADGGAFERLLCGPTYDFNADIAYSNGVFIQWPEGGVPPSALSQLVP